jgi:hypothetical protein
MSDFRLSQHTERRLLSTSTTVTPYLADWNIRGHTPGVDPEILKFVLQAFFFETHFKKHCVTEDLAYCNPQIG